jgi:hypothetical protein
VQRAEAAELGNALNVEIGGRKQLLGAIHAQVSEVALERQLLAPLSRLALDGSPPGDAELLVATLDAYGIEQKEVDSLLEWSV